jgi:DNA-binding NarL/FixJ family response regulator
LKSRSGKPASSRRKRNDRIPVWLVDDNRNYCVVLSEVLNESKRIECQQSYYNCRSAIKALAQTDTPPSIILLDIMMPKMSGLDAIPRLKQISPATEIIMLTSHDLDLNIQSAVERGATGYLLKTSKPAQIVKAIEDAQRGGVTLDSSITKRIVDEFLGQRKRDSYHLTKREKDILQRIATGRSTIQIAKSMNLSYYTIDTHVKNIFQKMRVHTRHGLVAKAAREQLIEKS